MSTTLTKRELVRAIRKGRPYLSLLQARKLVENTLQEMTEGIVRTGGLNLRGFGKFSARQKASRMGRNPKNGKPAEIKPRRVVTFYPGVQLKAAVQATPLDQATE